jgi:glycosyltransferase involved in cell wall biosynthesis
MKLVSFPKISIVTPNFNKINFLVETILSVISQDYPNLEDIIIDGGISGCRHEIIKK